MQVLFQFFLLAVGFVLLIKGADWFVEGASGIATKFKIPQLVIGLTIVAMGTSVPEAAVSISAAIKGSADITIGNIVGSNILNILIILGITAVIITTRVSASTIKYEIPYMIFITIVLLAMGFTGNVVSLWEGALLWLLFILYLVYLFFMARKNRSEEQNDTIEKPVWKLILGIFVGLGIIILGSNLSVDGAVELAKLAGVSERFIGLTIVALGTSLPELVTSVVAAKRGNSDIAIGNIVGSNIFNILFVIGTTAFIKPVIFASNFFFDTIVAVLAGVLLLLCVFKTKHLNRVMGIIMLACYAVYFISIM